MQRKALLQALVSGKHAEGGNFTATLIDALVGDGGDGGETALAELRTAFDTLACKPAMSMCLVITPLAVPQLGPCASPGRAWWLWAARHSQG